MVRRKGDFKHDPMDVFRAIVRYKAENDGLTPRLRWLSKRCGIPSTSNVRYIVNHLIDEGLLERTEDGHIKVVDGNWTYGGNDD